MNKTDFLTEACIIDSDGKETSPLLKLKDMQQVTVLVDIVLHSGYDIKFRSISDSSK